VRARRRLGQTDCACELEGSPLPNLKALAEHGAGGYLLRVGERSITQLALARIPPPPPPTGPLPVVDWTTCSSTVAKDSTSRRQYSQVIKSDNAAINQIAATAGIAAATFKIAAAKAAVIPTTADNAANSQQHEGDATSDPSGSIHFNQPRRWPGSACFGQRTAPC
jgi:hypothetical protein